MDPISLTAAGTALGSAASTAGAAVGTPSVLGGIGIAGSAGGGILGAIGNLISGSASKQMYEYQAGIARMNERISKQDADYARAVGETEAQKSGMTTRFQIGKIASDQAASGLDINTGSAAALRESQQEIGTHDQAVIRSTAAKRAYGYEVEAAQASAQGQLYNMASKKSELAGEIGAATSILGGATSVSGKWLDAKRVGIF